MKWLPDWLTGYDSENAARGAAADAELRRIAEDRIQSGYYTPEQAQQVRADYESDAYLTEADSREAISESFDQGWQEGRQNVSNAIAGTLNKTLLDPVRAILGGIPWWLWIAAAIAVFGYFGGFRWLKKQLAS